MRYVSTRGGAKPQPFTGILLEGLAPDGGLFLPEEFPKLAPADLSAMRRMSYAELAFAILSKFADDIPADDLERLVAATYTEKLFGSEDITPVRKLEPDLYLLGLSNGPSLAFKDLALQLLGSLFEYVLAKRGERLNVLGATSGDTGSSAEYALRGKKNIRVFMLSPYGRMSAFQAAQMYSLPDANIFNIAVRGVFDECQDVVKAISGDVAFKAKHRIGAVNSINWARVAAQLVYYFKACFAVGGEVSFAVPSGNFGNVYAGHVARQMGLPIRKLIVATNENNVLDEFFRIGRYRVRKAAEVKATSSPSMDISKSSNFERYAYDLVGRDPFRLKSLWTELDANGVFALAGTEIFRRVADTGFVSGSSTHADRLATIRRVWKDYGVMIDPHTADGIKVGLEHRERGVALVCMETAQPAKFAETIREALGRDPERPAGFEDLEKLPQRVEVVDADAAAVKRHIERHAA
ncbi:MAG: threonine synthase [Betaproteobacteria bacterium]|nr:MAG: threonine synthase [Betaproteobacteria bacterium]TMH91348.1 MAG: threonine synthase [Betaproteobacteria bacterium]